MHILSTTAVLWCTGSVMPFLDYKATMSNALLTLHCLGDA